MISKRQLQTLILVNTFGLLAISLPFSLIEIGNTASPLYVLLGGLIISPVVYMAISNERLSTWLIKNKFGNIIALIICAKIIFFAGIWLRIFSESIVNLLLHKGESYVVSILMIILALYTASKGIETRGRISELIFIYILLTLVFIFLLSANNINFENFSPLVFDNGGKSLIYIVSSVFGMEYLIFTTTYVKGSEKGKSAFTVTLLGSFLLALVIAFAIGIFGTNGIGVSQRPWAVLQIMDTIDFPFMLLERQDILMIGFWIMSVFAFINGGIFHCGSVLSKISIHEDGDKGLYFASGIFILLISFIPKNLETAVVLLEKGRIANLAIIIFIIISFIVGCRKK